MLDIIPICLTVVFWLSDGVSGEYCFVEFMQTEYCAFGCCEKATSTRYKECCPSTGPVIGIIIGILIPVVLIFIICICCCKRQANRRSALTQQTVGYSATTGMGSQQQPLVYQQGYVYPTTTAGYTPVPNQMGYPYQQGQIPPTGYQHPPPAGYPQPPQTGYQQPLTGYQQPPAVQSPGGYIQPPPPSASMSEHVEPSAPPPSYDELQKVPR